MPTPTPKLSLTVDAPYVYEASTIDKKKAATLLGKSTRTVEEYVKAGRLRCAYVNGGHGMLAIFQRADVEALKAELDQPVVRAQPAFEVRNPLGIQAVPPDAMPMLARHVAAALAELGPSRPALPPVVKPWLTLDEAVEYSGLPRAYLLRATQEREPFARNVGAGKRASWRFNREALAR